IPVSTATLRFWVDRDIVSREKHEATLVLLSSSAFIVTPEPDSRPADVLIAVDSHHRRPSDTRHWHAMAEKKGGVPGVRPTPVVPRPSFRRSLRDNEHVLPPEYLEQLEVKRKALDDSIHKYIAAKEREYKAFERELQKQAKSAIRALSAGQHGDGHAGSDGMVTVAKRRTSLGSTQDVAANRSSLPGAQGSDAVSALLASSALREQQIQTVEDDVGEDGAALAGLTERRVSEEREKEFVGLFTPPFITAIDSKEDRGSSGLRRESAPGSVEPSRRERPLDEPTLETLPKGHSDTVLHAHVKRPPHLQLAHRNSSSGSSADGRLASALKSPSHSARKVRMKRVSLAIGDNLVVKPSDEDPPTFLTTSTTSSHSRGRSPSSERAQSKLRNQSASIDFARQPVSPSASAGPSGLGVKGMATVMGEAIAASTATYRAAEPSAPSIKPATPITPRVVPKSASKIDADGDLFDLEAEDSDVPPHAPDVDLDSAIEDEEVEPVTGLAGRVEHVSDRTVSTSIPMKTPGLREGEIYEYDPEAGLVPELAPAPDTSASEDHAVHMEFGPGSAMASRQPTDPGFRRPSVHRDPIFSGPDYAAAEAKASSEDIYGSSGRPNKMSFTGGSLGESYMARHAEEMMRSRMAKREQEVGDMRGTVSGRNAVRVNLLRNPGLYRTFEHRTWPMAGRPRASSSKAAGADRDDRIAYKPLGCTSSGTTIPRFAYPTSTRLGQRPFHTSVHRRFATPSRPAMAKITVHKLAPPPGSDIDFGAEIRGADLEDLHPTDFEVIRQALYEHQVVIFKGQQDLSPRAQYELTRLFDPTVQAYGHGKTLDAAKSILHPDLKTIPHQPQVQVIGNGPVADFEGLTDIRLRHPHHQTFHQSAIAEEDDRHDTRFYRWHIDAALYDLHPPLVTSLLAVQVPRTPPQRLRYDDGSDDALSVPRGATAFVSSYRTYDLLSAPDQRFARTTRV
ncbi:Taurine catabolism dioxygenase TauD, TfdA family, partial [Teratosphaeria destructans]